jgi:hypothetical protein
MKTITHDEVLDCFIGKQRVPRNGLNLKTN